MKTAILQVADTGPLESLVVMLRSVGYECFLPNDRIKHALKNLGCDCVLDIQNLVENWGYSRPIDLPVANIPMMDTVDLYVDVKAHRNGPKIWGRWPNLAKKTLWYRINGGEPEHVIRRDTNGNILEDCGDERNPPCPILTPNLWYADEWSIAENEIGESKLSGRTPWADKSYACYPPFYRFDDYFTKHGRTTDYADPICLTHNLEGWGYGKLIERIRALGVKCHGRSSPDDLIPHSEVAGKLSKTLAMVHLKSSDAPGYSLYEALAAGCPLVVSKRLIWRNRMQDLLIPEETCLVFDRETHEGLTDQDVNECELAIGTALNRLKDPVLNQRIGMAGRAKFQELMWSDEREGDVASLDMFMQGMFPCQPNLTSCQS